MSKICCIGDANVCSKSSSCSMVLRSACTHKHSRESSTVREHHKSASPSRSKRSSAIVKKESQNGHLLHLEALTSSLKQLALNSTEKTYSILTGGFYNSFEISEKSLQNISEASSINVSCSKKLHLSQLSSSHDSSVSKNINHLECNSDYSSASESDINSSEHLVSTSNMSVPRRVTRSAAPLLRTLSSSEDENDITIHRIVRPRSANHSSSESNYSSTRVHREVTDRYLSNNHAPHFETQRDRNNHFTRYSGNSYGDTASSSSRFSESLHIDPSTVQNSLFHRFRWALWSCIYMKIINVVNFDVWLLSRLNNWGKHKFIIFLLLPLILYLLSSCIQPNSLLVESKLQVIDPITSLVCNFWSSVYDFWSTMFLYIFSFFWKEEEDPDLDIHTAACSSESSIITSFFQGISGLFGIVSGWLVRTGEKASLMAEKNHQADKFVYVQKEDEIKPLENIVEKIKIVEPNKEELKVIASEVVKKEVILLKEFMTASLLGAETSKLEKDKNIQNEIKNLHLEFKTLTGTMGRLEKEIIKLGGKSETKENIMAITNEYKNHIDQLNTKLKAIESKLQILEQLKSCCDKQWNEADFLALLEKHLILAFQNVINADSDTASRFHFFTEWLNSKFFNHEKLMQEINAALNKHKSSKSDNTISHDSVIKIVESTVLKHVEAVKRNLSESNQFDHSAFDIDMFSENKVKKIVKEAIMLYDADKIGQVDYALESGGGSVLGTRCSETYIEKYGKLSIFGLPLWTDSNSPRTAIQPDVQPGRCWAFKGSQGFLVIELSATIYPTGFTLEHIPVSLSPTGSIDGAPKNFSVWGLDSEKDNKGTLLGEYAYDINGEPLQYFPVKKPSEKPYAYVELQIHSNHGNMEYTCLYRFRVHGKRMR